MADQHQRYLNERTGELERRAARADYWSLTRGPWYGFLFALPILALYEVLAGVYGRVVVNGADGILSRWLIPLMDILGTGRLGALVGLTVLAGLGCWAAHRHQFGVSDEARVRKSYFIGMLIESSLYALLFGAVVNYVLRVVWPLPALQVGGSYGGPVFNFAMSLGAGLYEELFFRVILMGGLALLLHHVVRVPVVWSWIVAALTSSLIFSAFHYVGNMGDVFSMHSFLYRFIAGLLLAAIYGLRGFGIAVWTHALYDVLVMVLLGGG